MAVEQALSGVRVLELGSRLAAGGCGSLLSQSGAQVAFVDLIGHRAALETKHDHRALYAAGKEAVAFDCAGSCVDVAEFVRRCDVLITSHDIDPDWQAVFGEGWCDGKIVCDISAFGLNGPLAGQPACDFEVQALTGLIDTTGDASAPAARIAVPVAECLAALHAFGGIGAALRTRRQQGLVQDVEVALYDCAFAASASFLPKLIAEGSVPRRVGNRHPFALPWNVYKSSDEWVLICTSSNDHWARLAEALGDRQLIDDPELRSAAGRAARVDELDAVISKWVAARSADECIKAISDLSIPSATIAPLRNHPIEANLVHRGQVCQLHDPIARQNVFVPGPVIRTVGQTGLSPTQIPGSNSGISWQEVRAVETQSGRGKAPQPALSGIRVVEVGPLTTGPLCGRMLAGLGADVIKVEPPGGDAMRHMPPLENGQGYFFSYYNTGKRSVALDLKQEEDREKLKRLLVGADVLIQNLKEGAFARMGFTRDVMAELNPRLVRCDISGFGQDSIYDGRPAVDSVVQAMSGIMTVNRVGDVPMKTGISFVDLQVAILAFGSVMAALERRDETGQGVHLDLAMQDIANWSTQTFWNGAAMPPTATVIQGANGSVIALAGLADCSAVLDTARDADGIDAHLAVEDTSAAIIGALDAAGIRAAPLHSVADALNHPQTAARELHGQLSDPLGGIWPAVRVPIGLSATPMVSTHVIGPVGCDSAEVLGDNQPTPAETVNT